MDLVSISPIFYEKPFHTKVVCAPFMCLQFGFVIFWRKDFGAKAANKMLVKLTPAQIIFLDGFAGQGVSVRIPLFGLMVLNHPLFINYQIIRV
jgi:hypothetical protein